MTAATLPRSPRLSPAMTAAIGCSICLAFSLIPLFMGIFPVFLRPVSEEFGWGLSVYPQAPMIVGLIGVFVGPVVGRMLDRHGVRVILPVGMVIWFGGLFSLSFLNGSLTSLYLVTAVIGFGGTIAGPIAIAKVVNGWFNRNRGLALGLVMGAIPAGATAIAVPASQALVDAEGWRTAYQIIAVAAALVAIPSALILVREAPVHAEPSQPLAEAEGLSGRQAFRSRDFWLTIGASCLGVGAMMGVNSHFLAWMAERQVDKDLATSALSLYSLAGPLGPLASGLLVDRVSTSKIVAVFFVLGPIGLCIALLGGSAGAVLGMVFLGLAFNSINSLAPYLVSRYFGMKSCSEILAVTFAILTIGMGLGPVLVGLVRDLAGSYEPAMVSTGAVMLVATAAALLFQPYRFGAPPKR